MKISFSLPYLRGGDLGLHGDQMRDDRFQGRSPDDSRAWKLCVPMAFLSRKEMWIRTVLRSRRLDPVLVRIHVMRDQRYRLVKASAPDELSDEGPSVGQARTATGPAVEDLTTAKRPVGGFKMLRQFLVLADYPKIFAYARASWGRNER